MRIPIENIYYLLCYAWDKLDEKDRVDISIDDNTELLDLFAKILINGTKLLLKRGIDKSYIDYTEEIPGVKGKIEISQTLKSNLLYKQKTICTYDDFSSNILTNRILVSTIVRLLKIKNLDIKLKRDLATLRDMLYGIQPIELSNYLFKMVRLNRNNRFYGFIINVCQIIFESTVPSEEFGEYKFTDFTRDERKMNQLFEAFIRKFYQVEQNKFNQVGGEVISWRFYNFSSNDGEYLPIMKTDITLENSNEKIIIDTKYHSETLSSNYDYEKIKSSNLYQLFSYLINQEDGTLKTLNATGILLYPTIEKEYNLDYKFAEHKIQVRTVNLNQNWRGISARLLELIN